MLLVPRSRRTQRTSSMQCQDDTPVASAANAFDLVCAQPELIEPSPRNPQQHNRRNCGGKGDWLRNAAAEIGNLADEQSPQGGGEMRYSRECAQPKSAEAPEAVGKLMTDDRRDAAGVRSSLVEPIAHLMRSRRSPVTLIFQATAHRRQYNQFFELPPSS